MRQPGFVMLWSAGPVRVGLAIDGELRLGRQHAAAADDRISGRHARILYDGKHFLLDDLQSTNGTFVAGEHQTSAPVPSGTVIRCGRTIGLVVADITPFQGGKPLWVRDAERAAIGGEHLTVLGLRGSDRMRALLAYAAKLGGSHQVFDPLVDTSGLHVAAETRTLLVCNPRLLEPADRDALTRLATERPQLRVAMSSTSPLEELALPQRGPVVRVPRLRDDLPSIVDIIVDQLATTESTAHERVVEQCLLRAWPGEALELRAAMVDARRVAGDEASKRIMKKHLRQTAGQPVSPDVKPFVECFRAIMGEPPAFPIPDDYVVMIGSDQYEQMIANLHSIAEGPILTNGEVMRIVGAPKGWFQAGFWGHGVNSYSFYLAEVTDRHRTTFRLPYGGGAYSAPDEAARALAQLARYRKFRALPPTQVKEVVLVDAHGHLYDLELPDGRRFSNQRTHGPLDFEALTARVTLRAV